MPSRFQHPHAGIGADDVPIFANRARADGHEAGQVMVIGIHLGDRAGHQTIHIGDGQRGGWVEGGTHRLDGNNETGLLARSPVPWAPCPC
ncbi:MAG: hypothetical protein IPP36_06880 [Nitrosomonadales bacterium]|nr:hypothetical protein [Nitrosomonadales bacterium]